MGPSNALYMVLTVAGNFYSIENDYDRPARIFFSQGCEVVEDTGAGESQ